MTITFYNHVILFLNLPDDELSTNSKRRKMKKILKERHLFTFWLSKIILKIIPSDTIIIFRKLEKEEIKLLSLKAHRLFNETCLNNNVLPKYTDIYMCMTNVLYSYNY